MHYLLIKDSRGQIVSAGFTQTLCLPPSYDSFCTLVPDTNHRAMNLSSWELPSDSILHLVDDLADDEALDFKELDREGCTMVVDVGVSVLIEVLLSEHWYGDRPMREFQHKLLEACLDIDQR